MKKVAEAVLWLVVVLAVCFSLYLISVTLISQDMIKDNVLASLYEVPAEEAYDHSGVYSRDIVADYNLLNVIWNADSSSPIRSILATPFRGGKYSTPQVELYKQITYDYPPDDEYSRYWHGMAIFIRPLLVFFTMDTITFIFSLLLLLLIGYTTFRIWRIIGWRYAAAFIVSFFLAGGIGVRLSIEYMPVFFIACTMILLLLRQMDFSIVFAVGGGLTAFFDFFTAETLAFTIPALIMIAIAEHSQRFENDFISAGILWSSSYALTFLLKWLGSSQYVDMENTRVFGKGKFSKVESFFDGTVKSAFENNLQALIPIESDTLLPHLIILGILLALAIGFVVVFHYKKTINPALFIMVAGIPFVRILVLAPHSMYHYFMTFRAFMATIMAIGVYIASSCDIKYKFHGKKGSIGIAD